MDKNKRRAEQLGMPHGTASHRLRKSILFKYVILAGDNFCYKCGAEIESVDDLSIEHKEPWEGRDTELFWSLDNIAFSHVHCNKPHRYTGKAKEADDNGNFKCSRCGEFRSEAGFYRDKRSANGLHSSCKVCHEDDRRDRRKRIPQPGRINYAREESTSNSRPDSSYRS